MPLELQRQGMDIRPEIEPLRTIPGLFHQQGSPGDMLLPTRLIIYLLVITPALLLPPSGRCQGTRLPSIGEVRKELLSKYDANEDGWLDAQEREEVRKGRELRSRSSFRRRGRRGGRWQQGGNPSPPKESSISPSTSREQWQAVVNTFDKNKNGSIDGEEINRLYEAIDAGLVGDIPLTRLRSTLLRDSKTRRAGRTNLQNYDLDYDDRLSAGELDAFRKARAAGEPPPERPEREEQEDAQEEANDKPLEGAIPERAPRVVFSHPHGFQDESFELELTTPLKGAVIRYTLDCSDPDESSSAVFKDTLEIDRSTVVRARSFAEGYATSFTETRTYLFLGDVVSQSTDGLPPPGGYYRWGRNRVDYGMDSAVTLDPVYRKTIISDLKAIPSVSLVVDPQGLFSSETGIYSNATWQGRENERPGTFELLPTEGVPGFDINCGVRIRGGFSRTAENPKHAFRIFFRKLYGKGKLKYPFFGPAASQEFDNVDMRCSQNYSWNMGGDSKGLFLRDQFSRDLQLALGRPAARGDYYHLYLNGQYWGLYNSCERPEASFAASYFGGVKEDYDVVKVDSGRGQSYTITATDGDLEAWRRLHELAGAGLGDNAAYQRIQGRNPDGTANAEYENLLDVEGLVDYMLVILYGGNLDAPISRFAGNRIGNNWHGIRSRNGAHGFRFFIWDAEHTLLDVLEDRTGPFTAGEDFERSNPQWLWQQCLANAEFRRLVADRAHSLLSPGGILSPQKTREVFLGRMKQIEQAVVGESARWGDLGNRRRGFLGIFGGGNTGARTRDEDWRKEANRILNDYLPLRSGVVLSQLWRQGLMPDISPPRYSLAPGGQLELSAPRGRIYYCLGGNDPRGEEDELNPSARPYDSPINTRENLPVRMRVRYKGEWSVLVEVSQNSPKR